MELPRYSEVTNADLSVQLTKKITLSSPIISYVPDTQCLKEISHACGGLGILKPFYDGNIRRLKQSQNKVTRNPFAVSSTDTVEVAKESIKKYEIGSLIVLEDGKLAGIATFRDLKLANNTEKIKDVCTPIDRMVMCKPETTHKEALEIFKKFKIEQIPIIKNETNEILGLISLKDLLSKSRVFAGVSIDFRKIEEENYMKQIEDADIISLETTTHGHSIEYADAVRKIKEKYDFMGVMAGNVVTPSGVEFLKEAGADCVRVGIWRPELGIGRPLLEALKDCSNKECSIVAHGGSKNTKDIIEATKAGADAVIIDYESTIIEKIYEELQDTCVYLGLQSLASYRSLYSNNPK